MLVRVGMSSHHMGKDAKAEKERKVWPTAFPGPSRGKAEVTSRAGYPLPLQFGREYRPSSPAGTLHTHLLVPNSLGRQILLGFPRCPASASRELHRPFGFFFPSAQREHPRGPYPVQTLQLQTVKLASNQGRLKTSNVQETPRSYNTCLPRHFQLRSGGAGWGWGMTQSEPAFLETSTEGAKCCSHAGLTALPAGSRGSLPSSLTRSS